MAKALVTQDRVFEVAQHLADKGLDPSILTVQEAIGGGSYSTVKRYLDQWRARMPNRRTPAELPEPVVSKLMALGGDFWAMLEEQAATKVESVRSASLEEIVAVQTQLKQAEQAIAKLEAEHELFEQAVSQHQATIERMRRENQEHSERTATAEARASEIEKRAADLNAELVRVNQQNVELTRALSGFAKRDEAKRTKTRKADT